MGIHNDTVLQLQQKGIASVDDLSEFHKETIEQLAANLRRPTGRILDPNPAAAQGATIATPPFKFGVKSQQRLIIATKIIRYYDTVALNTTAGNLQWTPVMKHFSEQWKALTDKRGGDETEVPKITKALPIIKWTESFADYAHRVIGFVTSRWPMSSDLRRLYKRLVHKLLAHRILPSMDRYGALHKEQHAAYILFDILMAFS
jgi:hypothetical protein